jgi:hypothetical protein
LTKIGLLDDDEADIHINFGYGKILCWQRAGCLHSETDDDDDDEAVKALTPKVTQHIMAAMKVVT